MLFYFLQTGYVAVEGEEYMIEPVKGYATVKNDSSQENGHHPHLVYKRSALAESNREIHDHSDGTCGNGGKCAIH